MKFTTEISATGGNTTSIVVPPEIVDALGAGKKPPVTVSFNGYIYPSTVASLGGQFMIPVSAAVRESAKVNAGDVVEVELLLDTAPRVIAVPEDFAEALNDEPAAKTFFEGLSNSNKKRFVLSIEDAKTPETRQKRIEKSIASLREGKI